MNNNKQSVQVQNKQKLISDTGKSIDDYRNIIKTLKMKLRRAETRQMELEETLNKIKENKKNITAEQIDNLIKGSSLYNTTENVINKGEEQMENKIDHCEYSLNKFYKSALYLGLTLEGVYRACDSHGLKNLQVDQFRLNLQKLKLNLNQSEISSILYILDEECNGVVSYNSYLETLIAFNIHQENIEDPKVVNLQKVNIYRYIQLLKKMKITFIDSFNIIVNQQESKKYLKQFNLGEFYKSLVIRAQDGTCSRRDKASLWHILDFKKIGGIEIESYVEVLEKYANQPAPKNYCVHDKSDGQYKEGGPLKKGKNPKDKLQYIFQIFQERSGKTIADLLESLLLNLQHPKKGILMFDLETCVSQFGQNLLDRTEIFFLFKTIDSGFIQNGVIYYDDLALFYNQHKQPGWSNRFYVINLAKILQSQKLKTFDYIKEKLQQDCGDTIDIAEFQKFCEPIFQTKDQEETTQLWNELFGAKQEVEMKDIAMAIDIYRSDVKLLKNDVNNLKFDPKQNNQDYFSKTFHSIKTKQTNKTYASTKTVMKKSNLTFNDEQKNKDEVLFKQLLNKVKKEISAEDYFSDSNKKNYQTIFRDPFACLKKCQELRDQCIKNKKKWDDPEFGKTEADPSALLSLYFADNLIPPGCPDPDEIEWYRPEEICQMFNVTSKPCFFAEEGASSNDVIQSQYLGNCWFVSALSIVATHDYLIVGDYLGNRDGSEISDEDANQLLKGIYPPIFHFLHEHGIYVLKFFKENQSIYVIIDDKIAFRESTQEIVFGQCRPEPENTMPSHYWVSLIEKAYAKLHNCYQALFSGYIDESLQDLTGHASEKRTIDIKLLKSSQQKDDLWNLISNYLSNNSMLGCSANGPTGEKVYLNDEDTGLIQGHAYAIIDCFELQDDSCKNYHKSHRLIRIRNPWGKGEWQLEWSEDFQRFKKLEQNMDKVVQYYQNKKKNSRHAQDIEDFVIGDDGTFLMRFKDFRQIMNNLFVAIDFEDKWFGLNLADEFKEGQSGGLPIVNTKENRKAYANNPQYALELNSRTNSTSIFIQIKQKDGRLIRGIRYPYEEVINPIVCYVFKLDPNEEKIEIFDQKRILLKSGNIKTARDITIPISKLENGKYVIIPATKEKDMMGSFDISVYLDCAKTESKIYSLSNKTIKFKLIETEEEDLIQFNKEQKQLLTIKTKYLLY